MNARRIIFKLGGIRPAAQKLGEPPSTVGNWCSRNRIPDRHWAHIIDVARDNGADVSLADFVGVLANERESIEFR